MKALEPSHSLVAIRQAAAITALQRYNLSPLRPPPFENSDAVCARGVKTGCGFLELINQLTDKKKKT